MSNGGSFIESDNAVPTTKQIKAHGEVKTRIAIIWFVSIICSILSIGGMLAFFINPGSSKDIWIVIGPIISAGVTGIVTFFSGQKNSA